MIKRELLVDRCDVEQAAWYAMGLMDDKDEAEDQREHARQLFNWLGDLLLYQNSGSVRLTPAELALETISRVRWRRCST
jgi:hypothetical protein